MAKINRFILEYKDSIQTAGLSMPEEKKLPKPMIRRFVRLFEQVTDARVDTMVDYPLAEVLLITFLAVLANASTWADIATFGIQNNAGLKSFFR